MSLTDGPKATLASTSARGPLAGLTERGGNDQRGATAADGEPITDPSIHGDLDLTEGTDAIYAWRRPR